MCLLFMCCRNMHNRRAGRDLASVILGADREVSGGRVGGIGRDGVREGERVGGEEEGGERRRIKNDECSSSSIPTERYPKP